MRTGSPPFGRIPPYLIELALLLVTSSGPALQTAARGPFLHETPEPAQEPAPAEPAPAPEEESDETEEAPAPGPGPSMVRIGLTGNGRTVELQAEGGLRVRDRDSGKDVWKHVLQGPTRVVLERRGAEPAAVFSVQVASIADKQQAETLAERLRTETKEVVEVARHPDRKAWRVRVGQRGSRDEVRPIEDRLREMGFSELWVVEGAGTGGPAPLLRLVDEAYYDKPVRSKALKVVPARRGREIQVDGVPYRGTIEVLVTRGRKLQVVNVLTREDYLRGVVPKELGPEVFPEIEALKAQAVAARTYFEANRGQFSEDGYDICDTARCQVYGGRAAEHPLSDAAIEQTAGVIATFEGAPINALYTSTCGGHTEDLQPVFREMTGPYLKGVRCYPEEEVLSGMRRMVGGCWTGPPVVLATGEAIDDALAMLEVLGVLRPGEAVAETMADPPAAALVGEWTGATLAAIGKRAPAGFDAARELPNVAALAEHLSRALDWEGRIAPIIQSADLPAFLGDGLLASTPPPSRAALAYMIKEGILPRGAGGDAAVTRGLLARALHRAILRYEATGLRSARLRGFAGDSLTLRSGDETATLPLAARMHLSVKDGQALTPVAEHPLREGDTVEYHRSARGEIDYLSVEANRRGASDDRYSSVHTWEVRVAREDLEERIKTRVSLGRLIDLVPGKRGASGRIVDLKVVGSRGEFAFHGFGIETLLGLRETLFLVDRQRDKEGNVETFIFSGKGWGHGVGMCQVGAYGMAMRGRTYEQILAHYYSQIALERR